MPPCSLTVVILTKNESLHIARAIESVRGVASNVVVVDSFSTDDTAQIAASLGATVLTNPFVNYAKQFQWALDNAPISTDWVMRLDADEVIEPDLQEEIARRLPQLPSEVAGVALKRKHIFLDRWVRHGGRYPLVLLRIWRRGCGRIEQRWMDEHMVVSGGRTVTFDGGFADHNLKDLTFFVDKHNWYATREAIDVLNQKYQLTSLDGGVRDEAATSQAGVKRFVKEKLYNRLPFTVSSTAYFLYRYLFQLGFLDGRSGLVYHFLQGYWYRFLVGAKVMEFERAIEGLTNKNDILRELERLTGHRLRSESSPTNE